MIEAGLARRVDSRTSVQQVGEETLVYDERSHKAFCLNRPSAAVWRLCDGARTEAEIAEAATRELAEPVSAELVRFALEQLRHDGLVEGLPAALPVLSRRAMVEKLGVRALLLLPGVAAVLVPEPARAVSGVVTGVDKSRARALEAQRASEDAGSKSSSNASSNSSRSGSDPQ